MMKIRAKHVKFSVYLFPVEAPTSSVVMSSWMEEMFKFLQIWGCRKDARGN